ncbi:spermidine/spermine N(1)-acetyltransferase-like protein 1 isoform X1 [Pangasianodon hypophthalmus]|uniref:spermidine/spermine N(1)-acetyltransferase-like protein 1 isoform X1 n=1 Tax=Pangasianodon hypophthalmus TaxID=310915 RepID=UPI0023081974|nr:spermidine/spermine N(1)-acetyltransferase-like protein 1 isoform X1 [Pangasianodon hypophthalmus]
MKRGELATLIKAWNPAGLFRVCSTEENFTMNFRIRAAREEDCRDIQRMIMELAVYEKMADQVKISHEELQRDGFGPNPFYQCLIAEVPEELKSDEGHTTVGYALYFYTYSTWKGRSIYMEDLYVMPEFRGKGVGKALMASVARSEQCVYECARQKLENLLNKSMKIRMTDGRTLLGLFLCTDRDCNVILGSAQEFLRTTDSFSQAEPRVLGLAMIPGHHVVSIEVETESLQSQGL